MFVSRIWRNSEFSATRSCPLDYRTTISYSSLRCSFGSALESERSFPRRIGGAPAISHSVLGEKPYGALFLECPALDVTAHDTGKRWKS